MPIKGIKYENPASLANANIRHPKSLAYRCLLSRLVSHRLFDGWSPCWTTGSNWIRDEVKRCARLAFVYSLCFGKQHNCPLKIRFLATKDRCLPCTLWLVVKISLSIPDSLDDDSGYTHSGRYSDRHSGSHSGTVSVWIITVDRNGTICLKPHTPTVAVRTLPAPLA